MLLGYNTNGLAHHDLPDAVRLLAEIGYRSVAITIDHGALSPRSDDLVGELGRVRRLLSELGMRSVIETGARFLLDPRRKHEPTLITTDTDARKRRIDFYRHAIRCAAELGSDCVSLWSGVLHERENDETVMRRLVDGLGEVLEYAAGNGMAIGFEPEPGMFIDSMKRFEQLLSALTDDRLRLTLDVGHLHCQGETPLAEQICRWAPMLINVHLEDMRRGVHEHLMFGEGEIDFALVLKALSATGYRGGIHVELSRHSHEGPAAARRAYEFLQAIRTENA
jgi:sugar phosphate isomerase/epimerase